MVGRGAVVATSAGWQRVRNSRTRTGHGSSVALDTSVGFISQRRLDGRNERIVSLVAPAMGLTPAGVKLSALMDEADGAPSIDEKAHRAELAKHGAVAPGGECFTGR